MDKEITLSVDSMAYGGYGVARMDHKVIFIPYTVKGDQVRIHVTQEKRAFCFGNVLSVVEPSPWRIPASCPHFGLCGGCQWQHIEFRRHGELKGEILEEMLRRVGGLEEIPPIAIVASESPYGYRLRVRLKAEGGRLGYYQEKSHELVECNGCPIAHPLINETLETLRQERGSLPDATELEIRASPEEKKTVLVLHLRTFSEDDTRRLKGLLSASPVVKGIALLKKRSALWLGDPRIHFSVRVACREEERTFSFRASPQSFFQVHRDQNQRLIESVLEFSELEKEETFLDLYAGIGNFTLPLASLGSHGIGMEENPEALKDALFNGRKNGITTCHFVRGRVERILRDGRDGRDGKNRKSHLVVLDPPRTGGKTIMEDIAHLRPSRIVYISCNPATLARDVRSLSQKGYSVQRLALIDMFPQTYHMEVVALLRLAVP